MRLKLFEFVPYKTAFENKPKIPDKCIGDIPIHNHILIINGLNDQRSF